ncbi:MAG: patatin-like phospholipase family protein [Pseudomonadales bacterium]|nr:patatin-like phospholipase family protein [Pseudomonadales bacterium]
MLKLTSAKQLITLITSCILFSLFFSPSATARPKIGLALSGGGAKGSAHVGVLKILEENNIQIDYIAGTSIGSFVGAMYALGYSADEIEAIMLNTPWEEGYSDAIPREDLPLRIKQQNDQFNIPLTLGIDKGKVKMPGGFLRGQTMSELLREALGLHPDFDSFDELAIPYRAIATDLVNNEAVVLKKGDLVASVQASSTVPGALAPAQIDGYLLVDGGISNNMPVDVVKQMGADIVIAVDIGNDLRRKDKLHGTFAVLGQLSAFLTTATTELQKQKLDKEDILLKPDIQGLGTTDWSILDKALIKGQEVARQHLEQLQQLRSDDESYAAYLQQKKKDHLALLIRASAPIARVKIDNNSPVHSALIHKKMKLHGQNRLTAKQINLAIDELYSIDEFQRVDARMIQTPTGNELQIIPRKKSWGPNYIAFGLGWESDFSLNSNLNFDLAYTKKDITRYGGEWRSQIELGAERALNTELYLPLTPTRLLYSRSFYSYDFLNWDVFDQNQLLLDIQQKSHSIEQGFGWNWTQSGALELGMSAETGEFENELVFEEKLKYDSYGGYLLFTYDALDSISFPTQGSYYSAQIYARKEESNSLNTNNSHHLTDSLFVELNWKAALNLGNHAFVGKASYSEVFTRNDQSSVYFSNLGGFLNLSGYHKNALIGRQKVFASVVYQYDLGRSLLKLQQYPLYVGLSAETGNAGTDIRSSDLIAASTLYVGTDTRLGPVAIGFGANSANHQAVYFYLGKNF